MVSVAATQFGRQAVKHALCVCAALFWSVLVYATTNSPEPTIPVWQIDRDNQTSYIIGTPPISLNMRKLPAYYQDMIRSRPVFLTELGETSINAEEIRNYLIENIQLSHGGYLDSYLTSDQIHFIQQTMRRLSLTVRPKWKQILIPGYAGIIGESAAFLSPHMPPFLLACGMISATTGVGLNSTPTVDELLVRAAKRGHRKIVSLNRSMNLELFLRTVGPRQLKNVIDYIQTQQARGEPVAFVPAMQRMLQSVDIVTTTELLNQSLNDTDKNIELITTAHKQGGSVVAVSLLELLSQPGHGLFDRLDREGFTITRLNDSRHTQPKPCPKLLR